MVHCMNKKTISEYKNNVIYGRSYLYYLQVSNMTEYLLLILVPVIMGLIWWYQDNKREAQKLSDRLYDAENNITRLNNLTNKRRFK